MDIGSKRGYQPSDFIEFNASTINDDAVIFTRLLTAETTAQHSVTYQNSQNYIFKIFSSPLLKVLLKMYRKRFISAGVLKLIKSTIQFIPSLMISKILQLIEMMHGVGAAQTATTSLIEQRLKVRGLLMSLTLFLALFVKTLVDNQHTYASISLGITVRDTLCAALYHKSLQLTPAARQNQSIGELQNYMQLDTAKVKDVVHSVHSLWDCQLQVLGNGAMLFYLLGPSVLAGLAVIIIVMPLNTYLLRCIARHKVELLRLTDSRVRLTSEVLQGVRAIKSLCWERPFAAMLTATRAAELDSLKRSANARALLIAILSAAPSIVAVLTLGLYAHINQDLTSSKAFTSLALFNQLRFPLTILPSLLSTMADGRISIKRLSLFLSLPEVSVTNSTTSGSNHALSSIGDGDYSIIVKNCSFSWRTVDTSRSSDDKKASSQSPQPPFDSISYSRTLRNIDLRVRRGELVAVAGPVGCGKSSLLSALLGDMTLLRSGGSNGAGEAEGLVVVNGPVAYVSQTPWIPSDTLRGAVLFGRPLDPARYARVLQLCGLERDLELLEAGDLTEVGERGATLSGGQRQRLAVARALYEGEAAGAEVYLLDDPLSALDADVGGRLFTRVIGPAGALQDKTRLLVTHQLSLLAQADRVVLMRQRPPGSRSAGECEVLDQGSLAELQARGYDLAALLKSELRDNEGDKEVAAKAKPIVLDAVFHSENDPDDVLEKDLSRNHRLSILPNVPADRLSIQKLPSVAAHASTSNAEEDKGEGAVPVRVYAAYLQAARSPLLLAVISVAFLLSTGSQVLQQWAVGAWTSDVGYVRLPLGWYMVGVGGAAAGVAFFTWLRTYLGTMLFADSSLALHNNMIQCVLAAPLSCFESTPVGRLVQRFSRDMDQMDQQLPGSLTQLSASTLGIAGALLTVTLATPSFALVMAPVLALYLRVTGRYRTVARELKRADSVSRSPVYQQFGETLAGLQVIRAFRKQRHFQRNFVEALGRNHAVYFTAKAVDRWLSLRTECLGDLVMFAVATLSVMGGVSGLAGISLSNAYSITNLFNRAVRNAAEVEEYMTSVERILSTISDTPCELLATPGRLITIDRNQYYGLKQAE